MSQPHQRSLDEFDLVQIACVDMCGIFRGRILPREIAKKVMANNGCEIFQVLQCGNTVCDLPLSVPEILEGPFDNAFFWPVMDTLVELPWVSKPGRRVAQVIGHIVYEDGTPEPTTNRYQAEQQVKKLKEMGFSLMSSLTCQFTVFKSVTNGTEFLGGNDPSLTSPYSTLGREELMLDLCGQLQGAGVNVEICSARQGRGAFELSLAPAEGIRIADMTCRLKHGTRSVMAAHGCKATFMTYPHKADVASTCSFRFTLYGQDGQNAFFDESKEDNISDLARHWLAGMIHHGRGVTALCCPTFNCYKRFQVDTCAPKRLDWDIDSSSTFLTVLVSASGEVWIENRLPTSASNPNFVLLASLASGIDGIEKKMVCPEKSSCYAAPVPQNLEQAIGELKADPVLEEAMSSILMKVFISLKEDEEIVKFKDVENSEAGDREQKLRDLENFMFSSRI